MRPPAASASAHGDHLLAAAASSASAACTHECQAVSQPVGEAHWPGMALGPAWHQPTSDRVGAIFRDRMGAAAAAARRCSVLHDGYTSPWLQPFSRRPPR
jgi:hypothetical protein